MVSPSLETRVLPTLSIPFGMLLEQYKKEPFIKARAFNPFWDASQVDGQTLSVSSILLSIPFGMLLDSGVPVGAQSEITFNPFWDASEEPFKGQDYS